jgi:hypothetical protein
VETPLGHQGSQIREELAAPIVGKNSIGIHAGHFLLG